MNKNTEKQKVNLSTRVKKGQKLLDTQIKKVIPEYDPAFWLDLLTKPPLTSDLDSLRRAKATGYALAISMVASAIYAIGGLIIYWDEVLIPAFSILVVSIYFLMGLWAAAIGKQDVGRTVLFSGLCFLMLYIQFLTANELMFVVVVPEPDFLEVVLLS